jgi:predicted RNA-binding protein Jag
MEQVKKVFETYQQKVMDSFPSVYSKDDIEKLLEEMLTEIENTQSENKPLLDIDIEEFKEDIIDKVESLIDNYDFEDNSELELSGREINISVDTRYLRDEIRDEIGSIFDNSEIQKWVTPKEYV